MTAILRFQGGKLADPHLPAERSETGRSYLLLDIGTMGSSQYSIRQLILFFIYNKHLGVNDEIA